MKQGFDPLETTFMEINREESRNAIPQRCLVALIDVNKLKVNLNQLHQTVGKELQKIRGILTWAAQIYPKLVDEFMARSSAGNGWELESAEQLLSEKDEKILSLSMRVKEIGEQKQKLLGLIKRQTDTISKHKQEHEQQVQRLNYRVNQLYSIIHQKSATIDSLLLQGSIAKETHHHHRNNKKSVNLDLDSSYSEQFKNQQKENRRSMSVVETARIQNKEAGFGASHFSEMNLVMDPGIMIKINDLITSITSCNLTSQSKELHQTKPKQIPRDGGGNASGGHVKEIHNLAEPKQQQTKRSQEKKIIKPTRLDNVLKGLRKGSLRSQKLFK